jgi:hypothetical protein
MKIVNKKRTFNLNLHPEKKLKKKWKKKKIFIIKNEVRFFNKITLIIEQLNAILIIRI